MIRNSFAPIFLLAALSACQPDASTEEQNTSSQTAHEVGADARRPTPSGTQVADSRFTVEDARLVLPTVEGNPAAVFFTLTYNSDENMQLQSAEVEGAGSTEMHISSSEGGIMKMEKSPPVALEYGTPVLFKPRGRHLMAMKLDPSISAGDHVPVQLNFSDGTTLKFEALTHAPGGGH